MLRHRPHHLKKARSGLRAPHITAPLRRRAWHQALAYAVPTTMKDAVAPMCARLVRTPASASMIESELVCAA